MIDLHFLRRHYPDQVRGSRAGSSPLSLVSPDSPSNVLILLSISWLDRDVKKSSAKSLANAPFPNLFDLYFVWISSRRKMYEISQQAIEFTWFVKHWVMT